MTERLRLPFAPSATMAGLSPGIAQVTWGGPEGWKVVVRYGTETASQSLLEWPLSASAMPGRERGDEVRKDSPANQQLLIREDPGGLFLRMEARGATPIPPGGLLDIRRTLRFTPDPAQWE